MSDGNIEDKFYVYLGLVGTEAKFLKLSSSVEFYEARPRLLSGCVEYRPRQIHATLTAPRTLVPSHETWTIQKAGLVAVLSAEPGRIKCVMPKDFAARLDGAIDRAVRDGSMSKNDAQQLRAVIASACAPEPPSERSPGASSGTAS
jgi:hypothetical protein